MLLRKLAQNLKDPAMTGRWIAFVDGSTPPALVVESINPGFYTTSPHQRFYGGLTMEFPGSASFSQVNIVFYEDHLYTVTEWLVNWKKRIYDPETEIWGLPVDYKKTIVVKLLPVNSNTPVATFTMLQCWPDGANSFDLSYSNPEGRLTVAANFSVALSKFTRP